ncbi:hypothetical protein BJF84_21570 [Rhodococcus sp. CUA-806]|jgi:gentisate 1,2-dioxygenase|nr:hypothetical protein BJF84_21570 [Rhodococcus sp. CUA-806]
MTDTTTESTSALDEFDRAAADLHLQGQWVAERFLEGAIGGPKPAGVPYVWNARTMADALDDATVALGPVDTARRHLSCVNPGLAGAATTHTLSAGMQMVKPGEVCSAHRHSMSAIRFVTSGHPEAYTAVDGEKLHMEDFDLLLTPRFSWHDHHNPSDKDVVWLDALDIGLVRSLNQTFYEPYGESSQILRDGDAYGVGTRSHWLRPAWEQDRTGRLPVRYRWSEVRERLAMYDGHPGSRYDGLALRYANPVTGGPTLPTIDCWIQSLPAGFSGAPHRRTSSSISYVVSGNGSVETADAVTHIGPGDISAMPNWTTHRLINASSKDPLVLFTVTDAPVLQHLGLFHEEPEDVVGASPSPRIPTESLTPLYRPSAFLDSGEPFTDRKSR